MRADIAAEGMGLLDGRCLDTRTVIGLSLSACANAPLEPVGYGIFRM